MVGIVRLTRFEGSGSSGRNRKSRLSPGHRQGMSRCESAASKLWWREQNGMGENVGDGGAQEGCFGKRLKKVKWADVGGCRRKSKHRWPRDSRNGKQPCKGGSLPSAISLNRGPHSQSGAELLLVLKVEAKEPL